MAEINALETKAAADRERARLAEERARAIAPMLALARAAEAEQDFPRAAWTAENILAIDLECAEARAILKRARETLASQPSLADDTVDEQRRQRNGSDPDGTVTLVPITPWRRWLAALRSFTGVSRRRGNRTRAEAASPKPAAVQSGKRGM